MYGVRVRVSRKGNRIMIEPIEDPFDYALKCREYAKTGFKEFERGSEKF